MLNKYIVAACFLAAGMTFAIANDRPPIKSIVANPKSYIGKTISFRNATCVDVSKGGFLCIVSDRSHTVRIEAGSLGMSGGDIVAERLIGPCKGKDKLGNALCRFDVRIEPTSAQSEAVMLEFEGERVTRLYAGVIEMNVSKR